MTSHRSAALLAAVVLTGLTLAGCASGTDSNGDASAGSTTEGSAAAGEQLTGELTIFAAASLGGAFDELATSFEERNPGVDVLPITYDGSSTLATQLNEGASADVFASADEPNMDKIADLAAGPQSFATNVLEIVVAPGNPTGVTGLADLADPSRIVVMCAAEVPCGNASHTLLDADGVALSPASEEQNVTAVLAKVKSGEADAGLVYRTDVTEAGDAVEGVEIDGADRATNVYPLTALTDAPNPEAAAAFVEFVLSDDGQAVLADFGFGAP